MFSQPVLPIKKTIPENLVPRKSGRTIRAPDRFQAGEKLNKKNLSKKSEKTKRNNQSIFQGWWDSLPDSGKHKWKTRRRYRLNKQ